MVSAKGLMQGRERKGGLHGLGFSEGGAFPLQAEGHHSGLGLGEQTRQNDIGGALARRNGIDPVGPDYVGYFIGDMLGAEKGNI